MKVGIIGFGKMGMIHGALLSAIPGVEVVGIADTARFILMGFKSFMPKYRYFTSYQKMIDNCKPDLILVTTPTVTHVPIATYAAERGIHLFIEKPLTNTVEQGEALLKVVKEHKVKAMLGFCSRYIPTIAHAKKLIEQGHIGKITGFYAENYLSDVMKKEKGWRFNKAISGGGVVIDYTVHILDLLYWFLGPLSSVKAETKILYSESVEDQVNADLVFENGVKGRISSSWSKPNFRKFYLKLDFVGELGTLTVSDQTLDIAFNDGRSETMSYPDFYQGYYIDIGGPLFSIQMEKLAQFIDHNVPIETTLESGLAVQRIIDAIYRSAEQKQEVSL